MRSKKNQIVKTESGENESGKIQILPLTRTVLFPKTIRSLTVTGDAGVNRWMNSVIKQGGEIGLLHRKDKSTGKKPKDNFYNVGTFAKIIGDKLDAEGNYVITVRGLYRFLVKEIIEEDGHMWADIKKIDTDDSAEISSKLIRFIDQAKEDFEFFALNCLDETNVVFTEIKTNGDLGFLADFIMMNIADTKISADVKKMQETLEIFDNLERFKLVFIHLKKQLEALEYLGKYEQKAEDEIERENKVYFVRKVDSFVAVDKKKLGIASAVSGATPGQASGGKDVANRFKEHEKKLKKIEKFLSQEAREETKRELNRLSRMMPNSSEYMVADTFLDWITSLPWGVTTEDNLDLERAEKILDKDHFGLEFAKDTIIEIMAVKILGNSGNKGKTLLFAGPPGTGKTSLGQSIAHATGREFIRISVGGMRDEAELKGHKRTYVGALPGKIIQKLRSVKSNNPVFMIDEVDKMSADKMRGNPEATLLEILDPEQNFAFEDNYLGLPYDLSKVLFILTANDIQPISSALKDRTERIWFSQYTVHEKIQIANMYLVPKQLKESNLEKYSVSFTEPALLKIIRSYTREAGVRSLEKQIGKISRKIAREIVSKKTNEFVITPEKVRSYLGVEKHTSDRKIKIEKPGIVCGLAWTSVGGELLYVEAISMPGKGRISITGLLGESMRDSITIAEKYIRANSFKFNIPDEFCKNKRDIHLHVPAGAIRKDGPSAGITMLTALISLMTGIKVSSNLAMTGEITNRGDVQPIGGVKEKIIAAYNEGIKEIIIHETNRRNVEADIPKEIQDKLKFHYVTKMDNVLEIALGITIKEFGEEKVHALDAGEAKQ